MHWHSAASRGPPAPRVTHASACICNMQEPCCCFCLGPEFGGPFPGPSRGYQWGGVQAGAGVVGWGEGQSHGPNGVVGKRPTPPIPEKDSCPPPPRPRCSVCLRCVAQGHLQCWAGRLGLPMGQWAVGTERSRSTYAGRRPPGADDGQGRLRAAHASWRAGSRTLDPGFLPPWRYHQFGSPAGTRGPRETPKTK